MRRHWSSVRMGPLIAVAIAIALGLWSAGCLMLAVPEVAYEGYKYEHKKNSKPAATSKPSGHDGKSSRTAGDDSIE